MLNAGRSVYITPVVLENLALVAEKQGAFEQAADYVKQALEHSVRQDNVKTLPGEYEYLGQLYDTHLENKELAEHYYQLGYETSLRYAKAGIALDSERQNAIDAYVHFLQRKKQSSLQNPRPPQDRGFAYAVGLPWKKIKDTFHYQLLAYHKSKTRNGKEIAARLNMPATTLYSLQKRLSTEFPQKASSNTEPESSNQSVMTFIQDHETLSWKEINEIFEREMIHYLYEKYGYNKMRMSRILGLSYTMIIDKTRLLTTIDTTLLNG